MNGGPRSAGRIVCMGDFALGSRRAHAINVVKTAGGFARLGWEVLLLCREGEGNHRRGAESAEEGGELIAARNDRCGMAEDAGSTDRAEPRSVARVTTDTTALLAAYGEAGLRVEMLAEVDERTHPPGSDKRCGPMAAWAVERGRAFGASVMYSRQVHAAVTWADDGGISIAETHAHVGEAKPGFVRLLAATARRERPVAALSTISWRLKEHYVSRGAAAGRVHVVPDGVDVELFARLGTVGEFEGARDLGALLLFPRARDAMRPPRRSEPRRGEGAESTLPTSPLWATGGGQGGGSSDPPVRRGRFSPLPIPLPVPQSRNGARGPEPLAVYAGHLYDYKGIPTVLEAAGLLPGVRFELIGGLEEDIARVRGIVAARGLGNVAVVGWVDHAALPERLWRADVLLLPPGLGDASKDWTSPVKLGEYLAAGAPIVASGIPALRDWVDEPVVCWFEPDDAGSLASAIGRALGEGAEAAERRRGLAMELARRWSYAERARAMLEAAGVEVRGGQDQRVGMGAASA